MRSVYPGRGGRGEGAFARPARLCPRARAIVRAVELRSSSTILPSALRSAGPECTISLAPEGGTALLGRATRLSEAYTLDRTIGVGGMAIVRLARQHALDREVAVKAPLTGGTSIDATNSVLQEAWVTGALDHPGVVPVHDVAMDDAGCPHIVMRRIEGWTWTELLAEPRHVEALFGARDVLTWHLRVLMSVASTVAHAHRRGVVHRDLKPDNVMVGPGGEAYVLDWGLAAALDDAAARHLPRAEAITALAGTPRYMAPEMVRGEPQGIHTDVYLLGGLLHAVLTGEGPHAGDEVAEILARIPTFAPRFPPTTPPRLAALCAHALAADPAGRPEGAEAVRRAVQAWLEEHAADALVVAGEAELAAMRVARGDGSGPEKVVRHYAASRLGFEQALASAPAYEPAREGLAAAQEELIRWELGRGEAQSAAWVLAEMEAPSEALSADVAHAVVVAEQAATRAARLLADHDPSAGIRTRAFVSILLGLLLIVTPLYTHVYDRDVDLTTIALSDVAVFAIIGSVWFWARDSLGRSALNRAVIRTSAAAPLLHAALALGASSVGLTAAQVVAIFPLTASALTLAMAATVEPWLLAAAAAYLGAFALSTIDVDNRWLYLAAANAALAVVALWRWGPEALVSWIAFRRAKRAARA